MWKRLNNDEKSFSEGRYGLCLKWSEGKCLTWVSLELAEACGTLWQHLTIGLTSNWRVIIEGGGGLGWREGRIWQSSTHTQDAARVPHLLALRGAFHHEGVVCRWKPWEDLSTLTVPSSGSSTILVPPVKDKNINTVIPTLSCSGSLQPLAGRSKYWQALAVVGEREYTSTYLTDMF